MRRSKYYNMRLPERGAREGEANDAADIEDLTYDLEIIDKEMERQRLEDVRMEKEKATKLELSQHKSAAVKINQAGQFFCMPHRFIKHKPYFYSSVIRNFLH